MQLLVECGVVVIDHGKGTFYEQCFAILVNVDEQQQNAYEYIETKSVESIFGVYRNTSFIETMDKCISVKKVTIIKTLASLLN